MRNYLRAIWRCRYFWLALVEIDLRTRYRGSWLGIGWSLLQPLAMAIILCLVFFKWGGKTDPIHHFGPYVIIGLTLWNFFLNTTVCGCTCFRSAESYIRQYPAPMAIYPLRTVLGFGFHLLLGLLICVLLTVALHGLRWGPALLTLVPGLLLILLLGWALALLSGLATVYFPDASPLTDVVFHGLFYLTPIIYSQDMIDRSPELTVIVRYNPFSYFLRLLRDPILEGHAPSQKVFLGATLSVVLLTGLAVYLLRRLEGRIIYYL